MEKSVMSANEIGNFQIQSLSGFMVERVTSDASAR